MRFALEKERGGYLLRCWSKDYREGEIAYAVLGLRGPRMEIEFPSDWHEHRRAWVRIGLGLIKIAFSFPWRKTVPDDGQCSGPTYGFYFFEDHLVLEYGKDSSRKMRKLFINLPWSWKHREHKVLGRKQEWPYQYVLESGEVQNRIATIQPEMRRWTRWWLPWSKTRHYIDVQFDGEVGEETGSWKGGTLGCGYEMRKDESPRECLRRMERERKF